MVSSPPAGSLQPWSSSPSPRQPPGIRPFWMLPTSGIVQCPPCHGGLISRGATSSGRTRAVAGVTASFSAPSSPSCGRTTLPLRPSSWTLVCSVFADCGHAALETRGSRCPFEPLFSVLEGVCPPGWVGSSPPGWVRSSNLSRTQHTLLHSSRTLLPASRAWGSVSAHPCQRLSSVLSMLLFMVSVPGCVRASPCGSDLRFPSDYDGEHLFRCLLAVCISSLEKCLMFTQVFCSLFKLGCLSFHY